jgi:pre-mRNA-processing factor 6
MIWGVGHDQAEVLWLMAAKEKWLAGDVEEARRILSEAFSANPDSEEVWLAAFKLEFENQEPQRARALLAKARNSENSSTQRVWMKSAIVERELGNAEEVAPFPNLHSMHPMCGLDELQKFRVQWRFLLHGRSCHAVDSIYGSIMPTGFMVGLFMPFACLSRNSGSGAGKVTEIMRVVQERNLLKEGIAKFPYFDKLHLMLGQLEERQGSVEAARAAYSEGLKRCMGSVPLWRSIARLEEIAGSAARARALLEQVRRSYSSTHPC